jgi:predicted nucleic acid-binding protein
MTGNKLSDSQPSEPAPQSTRSKRSVHKAQEQIYKYLLAIVKEWKPEDVLDEFKHLFIQHTSTVDATILPALYDIVFLNQEQEFRNTIKRSCYILINNWDITRNHKYIQKLVQLFEHAALDRYTPSPALKKLRSWLKSFINSKDFQDLKLFASRYEDREDRHWSERYTSYLLVPQYVDLNNPIEQRQAARALSSQLKEKFKFDLAMYTARCHLATNDKETGYQLLDKHLRNPTGLGDDVLRLIRVIVGRKRLFNYSNLANIFIQQTQNLTYREFKRSLKKYLIFSVEHPDFIQALETHLSEKLDHLYVGHDEKLVNDALLLRTCNRVIEYLTTENHHEPSYLFITLLSHGSPLTLVIVLLKLILICRYSRTHLEARIANLIKHYEGLLEEECKWVVNFFEIFRITMAIFTENVEFSLVSMKDQFSDTCGSNGHNSPETYRIFSQPKVKTTDTKDGSELDGEILDCELENLASHQVEEFPG